MPDFQAYLVRGNRFWIVSLYPSSTPRISYFFLEELLRVRIQAGGFFRTRTRKEALGFRGFEYEQEYEKPDFLSTKLPEEPMFFLGLVCGLIDPRLCPKCSAK